MLLLEPLLVRGVQHTSTLKTVDVAYQDDSIGMVTTIGNDVNACLVYPSAVRGLVAK